MFWKDPKGLKSIPMYSKVGISILLIVAGVGYLLGFATIYSTYSPIDERPGMSVAGGRVRQAPRLLMRRTAATSEPMIRLPPRSRSPTRSRRVSMPSTMRTSLCIAR